MTLPLVYRHGALETVFAIAALAWVVFEAATRTVQTAEIQSEQAGSTADLGAGK